MNKKNKNISAYMTVEISLLFPVFVMVLMCIIYLAFYAYNRTIAFQNSAICALYGKGFSYIDMEEEELVERMYVVLNKLNCEQYIALDYLKQKAGTDGNYIEVRQEGNVKIPMLNPEVMAQINFTERVFVHKQNAISYVRGIRKVRKSE